ncbi:DUF3888 domain-containing protein [Sporosarcina sp. G11-34]|uniref:DUF3888 domain-containing protein n=1 Tax=Sporosarcina sp. G11-34 TaxID=2849605 RepID=UPI0022A9C16B|nr:DUF3888 domain-containing protein [Sporosarcina sp. G11-34]MCZ2259905.1 DUF3888 domain-containing protein [Sporosarcina sp. G11-34]
MKKKLYVLFCILFLINNTVVFAKQETPSQDFINKYFFDVNLNGFKELYTFGDFPFYNDKGQISPLGKTVLNVLTSDVRKWVKEPRIYVKGDLAYIHAVELDGLNILFTLKKENDQWKVIKREVKKLPTVGSEVILEKAFLRAIGQEILKATKSYYGEERLFYSERITDITWNENDDKYNVTIQIITYKGPIMPPFGFDTITLQIPGFEVVKYEHKDISNIEKMALEID